jgi:hypothetical protein
VKLVKRDVAVKDKRAGRRQVEVLYTRQVTESQASKQASKQQDCCPEEALGCLRLAEATYVNEFMVISLLEIMQHRSIIKVCQVGHILAFFILGGVDLGYLLLLEVLLLMGKEQHTPLERS